MRLTSKLLQVASTTPAAVRPSIPLFIASLGNVNPERLLQNHNAGHMLLDAILPLYQDGLPPANRRYRNRYCGGKFVCTLDHLPNLFPYASPEEVAQVRENGGDDWTFWKSPTAMNSSGQALGPAWREWKEEFKERKKGRMVILHDDLEEDPCVLRVRLGGSQRGHKGLTSCNPYFPSSLSYRISVGIGRPESRDRHVVSQYVLRNMRAENQWRIKRKLAPTALEILRQISDGTFATPPPTMSLKEQRTVDKAAGS